MNIIIRYYNPRKMLNEKLKYFSLSYRASFRKIARMRGEPWMASKRYLAGAFSSFSALLSHLLLAEGALEFFGQNGVVDVLKTIFDLSFTISLLIFAWPMAKILLKALSLTASSVLNSMKTLEIHAERMYAGVRTQMALLLKEAGEKIAPADQPE